MGMAFGGMFGGMGGRIGTDTKPYDAHIFRRLIAYLRGRVGHTAIALVLLLASAALTLLGPDLLRIAIDDGVINNNRAALNMAALAFIATTLAAWITSYLGIRTLATLGQRILNTIRLDEFKQLQRLSLGFFSRQETGQIMSRVTNDVDAINEFITGGIVTAVLSIFTLAYILARLLTLDLRLALATFTVLPVMAIVTVYFSGRARTAFRNVRATVGQVYANLQENISGARLAQAFVREGENASRFEGTSREYMQANIDAGRVTSAFLPSVEAISALATAIVIGFGGYLLVNGQITMSGRGAELLENKEVRAAYLEGGH